MRRKLGERLRILLTAVWVFAAWRWGDWRHWEKYQSTILYFCLVSMLQDFLLYQHSLWTFLPSPLFPNHTAATLLVTFALFPCAALIYLPHFPDAGLWRQVGYVAMWVAIFTAIEMTMHRLGLITYANGWNWFDSVLFDWFLFPLLRLHQRRPLLTYALTGIFTVLGLMIFRVPLAHFK